MQSAINTFIATASREELLQATECGALTKKDFTLFSNS